MGASEASRPPRVGGSLFFGSLPARELLLWIKAGRNNIKIRRRPSPCGARFARVAGRRAAAFAAA
eukprot:CAMPEP_0195069924 /NCGR_PEP_ID=MMETSP0448-20130528/14111_1 /TAXON_ID=66468 /ORGANISM="Heterocapsa triquestra, Strain CCMP 448" /LENGTH=64 /DNA_ID=CAMNT_0040101579 /DNA_START=1 /DNA_END=191 /DNA_ORIENTATION=-